MTGRAEVDRLRQRLDETFKRAQSVSDLELQADLARYLTVLVAGFLERATVELAIECCRRQSGPPVQRFVSSRLERFQNPSRQRLIDLAGAFNPIWQSDLEGFLVDQVADSLTSVVGNRNQIAHGQHVGVTLARISAYYDDIKKLAGFLAARFAP